MASDIIEIVNYMIKGPGKGYGLSGVNLRLSAGDAFSMVTDSPDDAHFLLRAIATLEVPEEGKFFYKGKELNLLDYSVLLPYKKKVGYIAADAALISNLSAYENLMLMSSYFENSTNLKMPDKMVDLCRLFELQEKLHLKPAELHPEENRLFIVIRELSKSPEILLIERPTDFLGAKSIDALKTALRTLAGKNIALVLSSADRAFISEFCNRQIVIEKGKITTQPVTSQ